MVMEYIDGEIVSNAWNSLDTATKSGISTQIGQMIETLRSIPSSGYYGRIHFQPFPSTFNLLHMDYRKEFGPYTNYEDFINAIHDTIENNCYTGIRDVPEMYTEKFMILSYMKDAFMKCSGKEPCLTSLDVKLENMMVKRTVSENGSTDYELIFIDWQHLGWVPAWLGSSLLPLDEGNSEKAYPYNDKDLLNFNVMKEISSFQYGESLWVSRVLPIFYMWW
jgi:hypothetical protein